MHTTQSQKSKQQTRVETREPRSTMSSGGHVGRIKHRDEDPLPTQQVHDASESSGSGGGVNLSSFEIERLVRAMCSSNESTRNRAAQRYLAPTCKLFTPFAICESAEEIIDMMYTRSSLISDPRIEVHGVYKNNDEQLAMVDSTAHFKLMLMPLFTMSVRFILLIKYDADARVSAIESHVDAATIIQSLPVVGKIYRAARRLTGFATSIGSRLIRRAALESKYGGPSQHVSSFNPEVDRPQFQSRTRQSRPSEEMIEDPSGLAPQPATIRT